MDKTCFFSGHRTISSHERERITPLIRAYIAELADKYGVTHFISGGALGFDTLCADIVISMQESDPDFAAKVRLSLYLPCYNQDTRWSMEDRYHFNMLKCKVSECRYITRSGYTDGCMRLRNIAMVDDAAFGIVYCLRERSGTGQTVRYAMNKGRRFVNLAARTTRKG